MIPLLTEGLSRLCTRPCQTALAITKLSEALYSSLKVIHCSYHFRLVLDVECRQFDSDMHIPF